MADEDPPYLRPWHGLAGLLNPILADAAPPRRRKFDLNSIERLLVAERLIPLSTLYFFLDFSFEGNLPAGGKTTLQLMTEDEVLLLGKSYAEWAKAPWQNTPGNLQERLRNTPDQFFVDIPKRISCMRARLWEGMTPMSNGQWKARKLDVTDNWQSVFEFLFDVNYTFAWLGHPQVQEPLKGSFNHISSELKTFESAINSRRQENGNQAKLDMRALWLEYIKSLFETMVTRTHAFFLKSVKATIANAGAEYVAAVDEKGEANCRAEAKRYGNIWSDLERGLHRADSAIMMPLNGYTGFTSSSSDSKVVGSLYEFGHRVHFRRGLLAQMPSPIAERHADNPMEMYTDRSELCAMVDESNTNHDRVRLLHRGEPKVLQHEPWVSIIHSRTRWSGEHGGPRDRKSGFVGYMLTHKPSEQDWKTFLSKLYADLDQSGQGVEGYESVKQYMDIHWISGKQNGIPHDDIEAAKRHFKTFTPGISKRVWKQDFLVVDSECFDSYTKPMPKFGSIKCSGDNDGYLKLIDTATYRPELINQAAPGFNNQMRVLGRLIYDDLYPQLAGLVQRPRDLWPLAMLHPYQVYVGYPIKGQMAEWEMMWKARSLFWRVFMRWRSQSPASSSTS